MPAMPSTAVTMILFVSSCYQFLCGKLRDPTQMTVLVVKGKMQWFAQEPEGERQGDQRAYIVKEALLTTRGSEHRCREIDKQSLRQADSA